MRAWSIRLAGDEKSLPKAFFDQVLASVAAEPDAEVRAQVAATAGRLPSRQALPLVAQLLRRDEDLSDPWLPLLCWWALEAHADSDREALLAAVPWDAPIVTQEILPRLMRRFAASEARADLLTCAQLLERARVRRTSSGADARFRRGLPRPRRASAAG